MDYFHEQIKLQKNIPAQIVIHTVDGYYNVPSTGTGAWSWII